MLFRRFEKYGLKLHTEKTRLVPFGQPRDPSEDLKAEGTPPDIFDFLGFTHYWGQTQGQTRTGRRVIWRRTRQDVIRIWRRRLAWRGDSQGASWERMTRLLQFYYLPAARLVHLVSE